MAYLKSNDFDQLIEYCTMDIFTPLKIPTALREELLYSVSGLRCSGSISIYFDFDADNIRSEYPAIETVFHNIVGMIGHQYWICFAEEIESSAKECDETLPKSALHFFFLDHPNLASGFHCVSLRMEGTEYDEDIKFTACKCYSPVASKDSATEDFFALLNKNENVSFVGYQSTIPMSAELAAAQALGNQLG